MPNVPPFMNSTGLIAKILKRIAEAQKPARFTQDFLGTKLGYASGSAKPIIPLLKRIGFLGPDGSPTDLYSRFRNPGERGRAMADAIRIGYRDVFERNEYAHELPREKFKNLIVELTGLEPSNSVVVAIVGTFFALKDFAKFDGSDEKDEKREPVDETYTQSLPVGSDSTFINNTNNNDVSRMGLNLAYTINLNLPETSNIEVFNAIFKSLKENLLK